MAEPGKTDSDLGAVLERIEQKMRGVESAQAKVKVTGRMVSVAIALVAVLMVVILLMPFFGAWKDRTPYVDAFNENLHSRLIPLVKSEAEQLGKDLMPILQEAGEKWQTEHLPTVMTSIEVEAKILVENLVLKSNEAMETFLENFSQQQYAKLMEAFPQLRDEDQAADMLERLAIVAQGVAERMTDELLTEHFDALVRMEAAFSTIEVPQDIAAMSPGELDEHISALLLELVNLKLNEFQGQSAATGDEPAVEM
ncbi:MAG: hypothetical protein KF858_14995 [Candidatus Sumerlaeia bacterium]|nr:hypothetical protein [Candidatus Sumerlaeia bacterium]